MHNAYVHSCTFIQDNDYGDNWHKIYYMTAKGFTVKRLIFIALLMLNFWLLFYAIRYDLHIR